MLNIYIIILVWTYLIHKHKYIYKINCWYNPCLYYPIDTYKKMAGKVDERIPENLFISMMIEKVNIIKDHLNKSIHPLIILANIGPTMAVFKFYDTTEEDDSLKLHMTLSNLGDIDEQIRVLGQQVNFLLQQYCSQMCKSWFQ